MRLAALAALVLSALASTAFAEDVTIRFQIDPIGKAFELNKVMAREYEAKTPGVKIEIVAGPIDATERFALYQQFLSAQSPDVDVLQVDVIWPGALGRHFVDLNPAFTSDIDQFFPSIVRNNTVTGKLVAIPWYADAGILYYRKDLLQKYGYTKAPQTWDELEAQSKKIMTGERLAGVDGFQGFVFQGAAYEGLTCNALEFLSSNGGGTIVDATGTVTVGSKEAIAAINRVRGWVGTIVPEGVATYREEECRGIFQSGKAVFMRNWPYAYSLCQDSTSSVKDKFAVTVLPGGSGGHAATLGGWQLSVSKYSQHQKEAIEFVRYLSSAEAQKKRALEAGLLPTRVALYSDEEIAKTIPYLKDMKDVFLSATPRPSTVAARNYNRVSTEFFKAVHDVLTGTATAQDSFTKLQPKLQSLVK